MSSASTLRRRGEAVLARVAGAGRESPVGGPDVELVLLIELRAALAGGATPAAALLAATSAAGARAPGGSNPGEGGRTGGGLPPELLTACRQLRVGDSLDVAARSVGAHTPVGLLIASLAISERTGARALAAVDQATEVMADRRRLDDLLRVRSTQARGTAAVLTAVPAAAWLLLLAADPAALGFYATAPGLASGLAAVLLALTGWRWARRILARAQRASDEADLLAPPPEPADPARGAVVGVPVALAGLVAVGPVAGVVLGGAAWAWASRPRPASAAQLSPGANPVPADPAGLDERAGAAGAGVLGGSGCAAGGRARVGERAGAAGAGVLGGSGSSAGERARVDEGGGAAGAVDLLAAALEGGLGPLPAIKAAAVLCPPAAQPVLDLAARRVALGADLAEAFAGTPLSLVGTVLAAGARWGAPSAPALRRLASDWRGAQRAAAEAAAERAELALVFPTTLLTLPAFALAVVPPLLWTAVAR